MPDSAHHKAEAERLALRADEIGASGTHLSPGDPLLLLALVHATLANVPDELTVTASRLRTIEVPVEEAALTAIRMAVDITEDEAQAVYRAVLAAIGGES